MKSREILLTQRPVGMPTAAEFELTEVDVPEPTDGQILVENVCMSVDPYMRGRMMDRESYVPPFAVGETLTGGAIGRVIQSKHADYAEGDYVDSMFGWREAFCADAGWVNRIGELQAPASAYLGVLGMPGLTAYAGLLEVGELKDGETVFVSGAAGAVGSLVGQIAKIKGCRVVGSAGTESKIKWLQELGFDYAFNYRDGNLPQQLREGAPEGIDVYFDNVGGDHLEAAIGHMKPGGRLALCGAIAQYNDTETSPGPNNMMLIIGLGLKLQGFIVTSFAHLKDQFVADVAGWIQSGELQYKETILDGVERAPEAFIGLFEGANTGKMIVNLKS